MSLVVQDDVLHSCCRVSFLSLYETILTTGSEISALNKIDGRKSLSVPQWNKGKETFCPEARGVNAEAVPLLQHFAS